jgi:zinc protease
MLFSSPPGPHPGAALALTIREERLDNGLRILLLEDHGAPVVSYQVHFAAGSRNERPGITGISHLFEHMMFKGTPDCGPEEFARLIQAEGGQVNAFTTEDSTCYYENLPAHGLPLAIQMESDRQANLLLTEDNLSSEREVVRNERLLRTVNTPYGEAQELLMALTYPRHSYGWPVVGWDSDLVALSLDDCSRFFATYYAPNNATVVVAGDFDPETVLTMLEEAYGSMQPGPEPPPVVTIEEPQRGERRGIFRKKLEAAAVLSTFHVPRLTHPDTAPLMVLATVLSDGHASRLHRRFVKNGRAGSVSAALGSSFLNTDPSIFRLDAVANPGDDPGKLEGEMWDELGRLHEDGVTQVEVRRAIRQLRADLILQARTQFYRGLLAGLYQVRAGDCGFAARLDEAVMAVTPEDVNRVARAYLVADNRTVVTLAAETA